MRTLRQLRDLRRYAPVTINNPQQVNIAADGGQQVNVNQLCKEKIDFTKYNKKSTELTSKKKGSLDLTKANPVKGFYHQYAECDKTPLKPDHKSGCVMIDVELCAVAQARLNASMGMVSKVT